MIKCHPKHRQGESCSGYLIGKAGYFAGSYAMTFTRNHVDELSLSCGYYLIHMDNELFVVHEQVFERDWIVDGDIVL